MEPILKVEELTKRFGTVLANDAISLEVQRGEIHCLLGENGAGKSTLAECIYGYYKPDAGRIYFDRKLVNLTSPSDAIDLGIGMVHQHFVLVPPLTVIENVIVGTPHSNVLLNVADSEARLQSLCENYGFELDLQAKVWQLSVGEQQWVEILKALYLGSKLLILDEPTAVLTPQETEQFFKTLKKMTAEGLSIILITHKLEEVMQVSDRITVLRKGKYVATVNTADVNKAELANMMVGRDVLFRVEKEAVDPGPPVLEARNLVALNERGQKALRGISFTLHRNEILGLAGVVGNGQKELFEVLAGVRKLESGQVILEKEDITGKSPHYIMSRGVGHIPEDRLHEGLVPDFSVAENLILGQQRSEIYRRGPFLAFDRIRKFARTSVSYFGIATPSIDHATKYLSGGNLQKIILARELWKCPQALLANQPTRGLDIGVIEYVRNRLLEKRDEGVGILLASEDLDELLNICDRIAVIFKGQILAIYSAQDADLERIGLLMAGVKEA